VKFGVIYNTGHHGVDPGTLMAVARHAEDRGFESFYMPEHVAHPSDAREKEGALVTAPAAAWTGTPPTSSPPTSQALPGSRADRRESSARRQPPGGAACGG
jgi:hypothetical protein